MTALVREGPNQFRVRFDALGRDAREVDPYLIGRAIAEVMGACASRAATGRALLWNEYRVVLSRADFESLGPLGDSLEGDLEAAATLEAESREAELVGDVRVSVVLDESDELTAGEAVVRAAFVARGRPSDAAQGLETLREDAVSRPSRGSTRARAARPPLYRLAWPGGEVILGEGETFVVGRPHPGAPACFVPLEGASARINKQQLELTAGATKVHVRRLPSANPVEVGGKALPAGGEIDAKPPAKISLSKGDLVLVLSRA